MGPKGLTYAQNPKRAPVVTACCKAASGLSGIERKSLISLDLLHCSEDVQSGERLDFSGFAGIDRGFSTKLSTVFWDDAQSPFKSST
jgi:hypothetical protein